jgi:hypothetical protein
MAGTSAAVAERATAGMVANDADDLPTVTELVTYWCIRSLRYPVETMLELLSAGMTIEEILLDYPDLERDDLLAVLTSQI